MKRALVTQEVIDLPDMPSVKRYKKSASKRRYKFSKRTAEVAGKGSSNSCIIPCTVDYDYDLTADPAHGFGWSASNLWVNGVSVTPISGASDLAAVFDCVRVAKVEITIMPGCDSLDYGTNTVTTGTRNIPYVYEAFDPNDSTNPSIANMRELATTRTHMLNKVIKRTIYPTLVEVSGGIVDLGKNQKNIFVTSGTNSQQWCGWKFYADMFNTALTYAIGRISFKVFYECRQSR